MSKYKELVKSFDNIRKLSQDFFIYGYNGRGDFSFISDRTYDNELRRVKSYLKNYVKTTNLKAKKTIAISSDTIYNDKNPLFPLFLSKSFTNTDCFLHFVLLDILATYEEKTLNEIIDAYYENYEFDDIDDMTIRNKLHEYVDLGIIKLVKNDNKNYYQLKEEYILSDDLIDAVLFYQNIIPMGYIMEPLVSKYHNNFVYKQVFFGNVLDDENVMLLLKTIHTKEILVIKYQGKRNVCSQRGIPLFIEHNLITGRRYVVVEPKKNRIFRIRIDKIEEINLTNDTKLNESEEMAKNDEYMKFKVCIPKEEKFVLERIYREVGKDKVREVAENLYEIVLYNHSIIDFIPYIRTYYGRIIDMDSDNKIAVRNMKRDLQTTLNYYEEEK